MGFAVDLSVLENKFRNDSGNRDFVVKSSDDFINLMSKTSDLPRPYVTVGAEDKKKIFTEFLEREQTNQLNSDDITKIINSVVKNDEDTKCYFLREFIYKKKSDQPTIEETLTDYAKIISKADIKDDKYKLQVVGACIEDITAKMKIVSPQITPDNVSTINEFIKGAGIKNLSSALRMMEATDIDQGIKDSIIASIDRDSSYVRSPESSPRAALTSNLQSLSLESSSNSPRR